MTGNKSGVSAGQETNNTFRGWCLAGLLCGALLLPTAAPAKDTANSGRQINDKTITRAVESELILDEGVSAHLIDTSTQDGVVTLSGSVNSLLARERAVKLAKSIRGVCAVVDQVTVKASDRSDREIRSAIETALLNDPATDSYEVKVSVKDGVATLTGTVDSWQEKQLSAQVAKGVMGVRDISNKITWMPVSNRSDLEIKADVEARLKSDIWINEDRITVAVNDGKVQLSGLVGSAIEKSHAASASWVAGVSSVNDNQLEVVSVLRNTDQRKPSGGTQPTDAEIKSAVTDAFVYDPRVYSFNPTVEVNGGVVTLTGTVDNLKAKHAAERDARNTHGVLSVVNLLKVRPGTAPSDKTIAANIRQAIQSDPNLEHWEIDVSVSNQKAYLSGMVDSLFERNWAETVASGVKGVVAVANNVIVDHDTEWYTGMGYYSPYYHPWTFGQQAYYPYDDDRQLRESIENQFFWSPFVDGGDITITVQDGVATLHGEVDSWREQGSAIENAYQAGAISVQSELKINGQPTS